MADERHYAHELYPHPDEWEVRPLSVEVPYLYARARGFDLGPDCFDESVSMDAVRIRVNLLMTSRLLALFADAVHQGMTGDEAWEWANGHDDDEGSTVWQRAEHYGVNPDGIAPYRIEAVSADRT